MSMHAPIDITTLGLDEAAIHAMRFVGGVELHNPYIDLHMARGFLNADECALMCRMIDANRQRSRVAGGVSEMRTSETCAFDVDEPLIQLLDLRISLFLGVGPQFGEGIQGQRYAVGQEFKPHADFFKTSDPEETSHLRRCGQRTWTAMIYLNEPEAGGETYFHHLDHDFVPEMGTMLCWNNVDAEGRPNPYTIHQGKPVTAGTKYIITKWFRQRAWDSPVPTLPLATPGTARRPSKPKRRR